MVAAFLGVKHRLDKMVGMKNLFGQDLTAMMKVVDTHTAAVPRKKNVDVAIGRVAVELALDVLCTCKLILEQSDMAVKLLRKKSQKV